MGLLLIGHPVFQMGKRTSQEAPLCGKTSENHSHLGLVSSILPHGSVQWGLVLEKLHGWCSSPCGHSLNSLLREAHARSLEIHCGFAWVLNSSVHLTASPLFERYQTPRRPFFFPSSWISSPYHPGVLTSKASYSWVNEDNSQLSRAISIKLWNPLVSPCLLEVAVSVSPRLGLIGTWAYWVWLSVMVLTQEGGPQQQVRLNFRHDKCHS